MTTFGDGYRLYPVQAETRRWAVKARNVAREVIREATRDEAARARNLRHGQTWFVGVDALPSGPWGGLDNVPLKGRFQRDLTPVQGWVKGQLSVVFPGYPGRDASESDAAHRYRLLRAAAHVDGLLARGPDRRRYPLERHAFVLGLPLTEVAQAPTLAWPGSHRIIGAALLEAVGDGDPDLADVTEAYGAARARVMETIRPVPLAPPPGGAFLMHRFLLHGTAPWEDDGADAPDGRMVVFFRPLVADTAQWLARDWATGPGAL
ncbi:hypothetical protein [Marinibacterium sp. SX1]|uniref:hypothetical protein n=1 Tax=Marinibacterium sp. SX1 TaxID=3388424 RepID=UPI003D16FD75